MYYTTYGYILISKNIYDIKSFANANRSALQAILDLKNDPSQNDISLSFDYDNDHRILISFTCFGDTVTERNVNFIKIFTTVRRFFPSCKTLIKVDLKDDGENTFFNDILYDYLNREECPVSDEK